MAHHNLNDLLSNARPDPNPTILFPDEQQRIEEAVLRHTISGHEIAELAEVFGYLADMGIQWQDVISQWVNAQPDRIGLIKHYLKEGG